MEKLSNLERCLPACVDSDEARSHRHGALGDIRLLECQAS